MPEGNDRGEKSRNTTKGGLESGQTSVHPQPSARLQSEKTNPLANNKLFAYVRHHPLLTEVMLVGLVLALIAAGLYWQDFQSKIYIEKAEVNAPVIFLGPQTPGIIEKFYVHEESVVSKGQKLAMVGDNIIEAKTNGIVVDIMNAPGQWVTPQSPVVEMIDPSQFRVIGRVQEDRGLKDIHPGQRVMFTVDAFGQKEYAGTVEMVAETARQSDIVFSISDKREPREFEVTVIFDVNAYPELKNGMSAKMWVYK